MVWTKTTSAIVLKRQDYRENDSLVVFYTQEYGKQTLIARGTKRSNSKLAGHIEPLNLVNLMIVPGKGRDYAAGISTKNAFLDLKDNINSLHWAFLAISWFLKLIPESEDDKRLFMLLQRYLEGLDEMSKTEIKKEEGEILFSTFSFRMLSIMGYEPQTKNCLKCQENLKELSNHFDLQSGGFLCQKCFLSNDRINRDYYLKVSANTIKFLRFIFNNKQFIGKKVKVDKKTREELVNLVERYLEFRL